MIPICRVCLRTDRKVQGLDDALSSLFDELCDYESDSFAKFCTECVYELAKFYKFKEKCQLATKTLKNWKKLKPPAREPPTSLFAKMPPSRISLCNRKNFKMYFCKAHHLKKVSTSDIANSNYPHIVTLNVPDKDFDGKNNKYEHSDFTSEFESITEPVSSNDNNEPEPIFEVAIKSNNVCEPFTKPPVNCFFNKNHKLAETRVEVKRENTVEKNNTSSAFNFKEVPVYDIASADGFDIKNDLSKNDEGNDDKNGDESNVKIESEITVGKNNTNWNFEVVQIDNIADADKDVCNNDADKEVSNNDEQNDDNIGDDSDIDLDNKVDLKIDDSQFNIDQLISTIDVKTVYDTSDDEVLTLKKLKKAKKKIKSKVPRKRKMTLAELAKLDLEGDETGDVKTDQIVLKKRGRKISLEELRKRLVKQFTHCGVVKDEEGNVIDTNVILDSLDSMPVPTLRQLKNQVAAGNGIKVLTPASIKLLAHLQKKYSNEYSNGFTVEHLGTREQVLAEFAQRQHYESYTTAEFKCELCYTAFKSYKTLVYHKKACHNEKDPHVCTICSVRYNKEASLKWHYFSHRTVFKCKLCPFVTYQKHTMMLHYNIHAGISYNCKNCEASFKSRSGLYLHMNTAHKTKHECDICGRGFSTEYGLKVHQYMAHQEGELETSTCVICDKTFDNYEKYKRHVSYLHSEQLPDMLRTKKQKVEKGGRKYGVPNMFCPVCKKQVNSVGAMRWHFKVDHPNESFEVQYSGTHKHLCHECGKGFHALSELNDHKNLHTGAKPYSCNQCSATFYRKRNMTLHVSRHNPPSKECKQCGKKFRSGSNLYNHMRTHSGDRRYKCGICPKAFLHASALSAHTRGVHNHIRRVKKKSTTPIYE